ncbi:hypothetical protein LPMP_270580 [Leishmania panamensis]|uniref:Dynein complex assembly factor, putative n=1 Tax=Leishmania panamensis TaxID=5679 RepID=A0A088RU45_LEIPA|nr:hypothetical protein LPMP_270580 [Leishmania panamensis]AIN99440.1 hypothetical protein LPMP_270580 [Leishmania panamensis]
MSDKYLRNEQQQLLNSIGTEVCWGWSPAIDFVSLLAKRPHRAAQQSISQSIKSQIGGQQSETPPSASSASVATAAPSSKSKEEAELDDLIAQIQGRRTATAKAAQSIPEELSESKPQCSPPFSSSTASPATAAAADDEVTVLLAGASDIRHLLRTLSSLRAAESANGKSGSQPTYHFYIYEPSLRLHCRHLFFLQWLLDSMFSLEELEERVLMFLDVYGNALMRDMTAAQVRNVVQRLRTALETDSSALLRIASFEEMKSKERDFVESQLAHWNRDASVADIREQWMQRVRQEMAERYDNRDNIIDWDFVFHLTEYTNLLKFPEYRTWRNTGVAFDVNHINPRRGFSYEYSVPNKTLCFFPRSGRGVYSGDIKNGPFFSFGALTPNAHIRHRTTDGTCKYGNGVVSMHNVRAWLYTLMTGLSWPWADHAFAWDDPRNYNYLPPGTPSGVAYTATLPKVRVHFVGLEWDRFMLHCKEGKVPRMDAAFFGASCTQYMTPTVLGDVMSRAVHAVVVAETAKFIVDAEDVAKTAYIAKLDDLARAGGWTREDALTSYLHDGKPDPLPVKGTMSDAQRVSQERYAQPSLLAYVAKASA